MVHRSRSGSPCACMSPVILLSDGYLANGAEPWLIPDLASLKPIEPKHPSRHPA